MGNREALLAGALASLLEKGFARTTARDVAARAGTSLAAIGYHFGGTERLLLDAIGEGFGRWRAEVAGILADHADKPIAEAVDAVGEALDRLMRDQRALGLVFLEALALADREPELRDHAARLYDADRDAGAAMIADARGSSRDDDRVAATMLIALVDGLIIQSVVGGLDVPTAREVLRLVVPTILAID